MTNDKLEAALAYALAGWPTFPVRANSKEPATMNGFLDATTDAKKIASWWGRRPELNIGVATGAPGPDVIDVDVREQDSGFAALNKASRAGLIQGYSALVRTPSTGIHLYFSGSEQRSAKLPRQHIDFKGGGGYVLAPPSYAAGANYVVVKHQPSAVKVDWRAIAELLEPQAKPERRAAPPGELDLDRLTRWVTHLQPGNRNGGLHWAAARVAEAGWLDADTVERLVEASLRSGIRGGEREARRTIQSAPRPRVEARESRAREKEFAPKSRPAERQHDERQRTRQRSRRRGRARGHRERLES